MFKKLFSLFLGASMGRKGKHMNNHLYDPTRTLPTDSYMNKLIKSDNNVSAGNFFLIATTIVGLLLLLVPLFALVIEAWFNHTITTDLTGMASYIVAVCSIFTVGGLTHGWTHWSESKFRNINRDNDGNEFIPEENIIDNKIDNEEEV